MSERPNHLFKYCSASAGLRIAGNAKLRFTPPNEFNDPFDAKPVIRLESVELEKITSDVISRHYAFAGILNGDQAPTDFATFRKTHWIDQRESVAKNLATVRNSLQNTAHDSLSTYAGISCLCTEARSLRMWGYYTDNHRGCVVQLDITHPFFANNRSLTQVRYGPSRPVHTYGDSGDWVYQKSMEWEHESEWRMMGELSTLEKSGTDNHGNTVYLASFPPEALTAIYLGIRMSADDIQRYEELVRKPKRQHIKLFKVRPDPERFALHFDPHLVVSV